MAFTSNTRPAPFGAITIHNLTSRLETAWAAIVDWNTQRKTRAQLCKLSDRELADIGLYRGALENPNFRT
ncbi:MAG: DUF1127 domain-containing protein [Rhodobacteraceae bacterium]|nr:DUF1127 domain-containing protein [Paracoccaceae bacterium]